MAEGWPVQVQSSQSMMSAMEPLAKAASLAGTFCPLLPQIVASSTPPFSVIMSMAFWVWAIGAAPSEAAMQWRVILLPCSITSCGMSSYFKALSHSHKRVV